MSYSKRLENFILELKGGVFFLSPREKMFLDFLEEMEIPESVVREGIEKCYTALSPKRRSKHPVFLCFKSIMEVYENFQRLSAQKVEIDWRRRFKEKIKLVSHMIDGEVCEPDSEESAHRILKELERSIVSKLWKKMSKEERERIMKKYAEFKNNKEIFRELVKREVQKFYGIPDLSLYVG